MKNDAFEWMGGRMCVICGREFNILYPDMWTYKRWARHRLLYFCSYKCMRKYDAENEPGEGLRKVGNRCQVETGRELLAAMEAGEEPLVWLRKQGYRSPEKAYQNIKAACKAKAPELGDRFPDHMTKERARKTRMYRPNEGKTHPTR